MGDLVGSIVHKTLTAEPKSSRMMGGLGREGVVGIAGVAEGRGGVLGGEHLSMATVYP